MWNPRSWASDKEGAVRGARWCCFSVPWVPTLCLAHTGRDAAFPRHTRPSRSAQPCVLLRTLGAWSQLGMAGPCLNESRGAEQTRE